MHNRRRRNRYVGSFDDANHARDHVTREPAIDVGSLRRRSAVTITCEIQRFKMLRRWKNYPLLNNFIRLRYVQERLQCNSMLNRRPTRHGL